jgi:hypothetical protein
MGAQPSELGGGDGRIRAVTCQIGLGHGPQRRACRNGEWGVALKARAHDMSRCKIPPWTYRAD